jgi:hypothetical protein
MGLAVAGILACALVPEGAAAWLAPGLVLGLGTLAMAGRAADEAGGGDAGPAGARDGDQGGGEGAGDAGGDGGSGDGGE